LTGTWDAVANDLSGLSSKLEADKLEDLNNILVNIDQKMVLKKWKALEDQSKFICGYASWAIVPCLGSPSQLHALVMNAIADEDDG
jgi:hypothetical protein